MDQFETDEVLKTFRVIADTREQLTPKCKERFVSIGVPVERATLNYCDYCANITLPSGEPLYTAKDTIKPVCAIERKMSLDELAGCFTRDRERFEREFLRATDNGAIIYLLIENATWEAIEKHRYRSRFHPSAFMASLSAWTARYNLRPIMCKAETSGHLIREILYRDIKERLLRGDYG